MPKLKDLYDFARDLCKENSADDPFDFVVSGSRYLGVPLEDIIELGDTWDQVWFIASATIGYQLAARRKADAGRAAHPPADQLIGEAQVTCECGRAWSAPLSKLDLYIGVIPALMLGIVRDDAVVGVLVTKCQCGRRVEKEIKPTDVDRSRLSPED